ncbi:hypothetical protein BGZ65_005915 [Modicella reniformis]|uniref:Uncharacterized protein n=1 Tax=Modicella reniformis TaxID=1440133 RepID=A0A9P6MB76_9FUNG|nr:hypothetical protein BGZ65_005915 [Modicella reniformis]
MDEYQMIEQHGVQELVRVSLDEKNIPCIYLKDIERIFPNITTISSYGLRIPFAMDASNIPKQPLRIPHFENRVLEVDSDNSALEWSREATAARIVSFATVHTASTPGILDLDPRDLLRNDIDNDNDHDHDHDHGDDVSTGSEDFFDMAESATSSDNEEEDDLDDVVEYEEYEEQEESLSRRSPHTNIAIESTIATAVTPTVLPLNTRALGTVQDRGVVPVPENNVPFTRDMPPAFNKVNLASATAAPIPTTSTSVVTSHYPVVPVAPEIDREALPPPSYESIDPTTHYHSAPLNLLSRATASVALDDPSERHLVLDRISIIKRISQSILIRKYGAESCPHPPLFVLLPENPPHWSDTNILHNKMRLYFLCSCCEHEVGGHGASRRQQALSRKRNIHVHESKGFEIRLNQFQDQMLLIKFGHYILNLLRMLQYGVLLDDVFVPAAFDRPIPPNMNVSNKLGINPHPHLFLKLKQNIERSIIFMEALLGDDYEEEATEAVKFLDMNDFRILDWIVKRPSYTQSSCTESTSTTSQSTSTTSTNAADTDMSRELAMSDIHLGGSGLYKVLGSGGSLSTSLSSYKRLLTLIRDRPVCTATSENQLNAQINTVSKIKALFKVDITFDWVFGKSQLNDFAETLQNDATTVSTVAIRFSKRVPPLAWRKHLSMQIGEDQQHISAVLNIIKNRRVKHLILEGDIDMISVPTIGTMDFSNLDILSIMRTNHRGFNLSNNNISSSGNSTHSNDTLETGSINLQANNRASSAQQDEYIPELISFLQSCNFLTELSLGFPDSIPGHVRILQACITGLSRLRRLDLFRVLGSYSNNNNSSKETKSGTAINRKLELSASVSSSRVTRLYMTECKATGENKAKLLESLEELLMDEGSHLEDLELYFVGFNDKHAHALEVGTRPLPGHEHSRLRRLVIHGNGLEHGGVIALQRVLKRVTRSDRPSGTSSLGGSSSQGNRNHGNGGGGGNNSAVISIAAAAEDPEVLSFGTMREQTTLLHLELRSMDSLTDYDWAWLLSELNLRQLLTLDLQGVGFGDRAMAILARTGRHEEPDPISPSQSPTSESSAFALSSYVSLPPAATAPPAFFSSSAPLNLQTLRLGSSASSHRGVVYIQEFLSRLVHLSTLSLHGFRRVASENWIDIMTKIPFRWIEVFEIVSLGYDDDCAKYLGERFKTREQIPETLSSSSTHGTAQQQQQQQEEESQMNLPVYCVRPLIESSVSVMTTSSSSTSVTCSSSSSPSTYRVVRRESRSSRLFNSLTPSVGSSSSTAVSGRTICQKSKDKDPEENIPSSSSSAVTPGIVPPPPRRNPSQKYLEINLRYTDVSSEGLVLLRADTVGQAQKVVVHGRDEEDASEEELARLAAKYRRNGHGKEWANIGPVLPSSRTYVGMYGGTGISPASVFLASETPLYYGGGSSSSSSRSNNNSSSNGTSSNQQPLQPTRSSTFMKLKNVFKKHQGD